MRIAEEESDVLFEQWTIPSPARPLFEAALANFNPNAPTKVDTANSTRGPLLLISGTADHTVPDVTTQATFKLYRHSLAVTELKQFEGRGHSLTIDHGWPDVARAVLAWLKEKGLSAAESRTNRGFRPSISVPQRPRDGHAGSSSPLRATSCAWRWRSTTRSPGVLLNSSRVTSGRA